MKRFYGWYLLSAVILAAIFFLPYGLGQRPAAVKTDMQEVNNIVNSVIRAKTWADLAAVEFDYDFVVFRDGRLAYRSAAGMPDSINEGLKQGMITADRPDYPGRIMIAAERQKEYEAYLRRWERRNWVILPAALLIMAAFWGYIRRVILRPFQKMAVFAGEVANGRLDLPLPMDRRNIFGAFTESFDILREGLKESRRREMESNRDKKELIASLSHDIKTPVTVIRLHLDYLQTQLKEEKYLEKLNAMALKTDQIDFLVNNLLQSTLEELGHLAVNPVDQKSGELTNILRDMKIEAALSIGPVPSCLVVFDHKRIEQVIANILYNAEKYAGTAINAVFTMADPFLQLDINDRGNGVAEAEIEYLREKFYRGRNAAESGKDGDGLGLYIAGYLMERMGGELICLNRPDGFTVRLLIPLSP